MLVIIIILKNMVRGENVDKNINIEEIKNVAADNHLIQESGGQTFCPVCGGDLEHFIDQINDRVSWVYPTQKAHLLSNDKPNKKKFGKIIVEDTLNHMLTCSNKCNDLIQLRNNPVEQQKILLDVLFKYMSADPTPKQVNQLYSAWCYFGKLIISADEYKNKYYIVCQYFIMYERSME